MSPPFPIRLNLGGEAEEPDVINQQPEWVASNQHWKSVGPHLAPLIASGEPFLFCKNTQLPFPDESVDAIISNNVPIDVNTWLGPGVQTSEIQRVLRSGRRMASRRRSGLHEAMNKFASLLKTKKGKLPSEAQRKARSGFSRTVSASRLKLRKPFAALPQSGKHFIIGVASYSPQELRLLDELQCRLEKSAIDEVDISVFDVLDCDDMSNFGKFIPGIDAVSRTPVVGVIVDGKLVDRAAGLSEVVATLRRFHVLNHC